MNTHPTTSPAPGNAISQEAPLPVNRRAAFQGPGALGAPSRGRAWRTALRTLKGSFWLVLAALPATTRAGLSEPDNLLYGTLVIGTQMVTAAHSDVVVEARKTPGGPVVASYRMGSNPQAGNFYALRIPVEALSPLSHTNASPPGGPIHLTLRDAAGLQAEASYNIPARGQVQRLDFGVAPLDADGNRLPDAWEIAHFGAMGQDPGDDPDLDGMSNEQEWIAGTNPNDGQDVFALAIAPATGYAVISFLARRAEGPGYVDVDRIYALEFTTNLTVGAWTVIPAQTNLLGNNKTVTYPAPATNDAATFRGRISIRPR